MNHDPAIDRELVQYFFALKERSPVTLAVVRTHHVHELLAACDGFILQLPSGEMMPEWESIETVDRSRTTKILDPQRPDDFTEYLTVKIKTSTFQLKLFHPLICGLLFTDVICDAHRLVSSRVG